MSYEPFRKMSLDQSDSEKGC